MGDEDLKNYDEAFSNLCNNGIIIMYGLGNYGVPKEGRRITDEIVNQKKKRIYGNLRILML